MKLRTRRGIKGINYEQALELARLYAVVLENFEIYRDNFDKLDKESDFSGQLAGLTDSAKHIVNKRIMGSKDLYFLRHHTELKLQPTHNDKLDMASSEGGAGSENVRRRCRRLATH